MTDKLPPLSTQIVPPSQTSYPLPIAATIQHVARKQETVEEEPYTIKCICGFADDDGNTIYCEKCDTWQHIECYYHDNAEEAVREDFTHSCVDCDPRPVDRQQAIERQRARTAAVPIIEEEATDRKPKRPPSKSHKKKLKPTDLHLNGNHTGPEHTKHTILHDHTNPHPPKKPKNSHKASQSISSQAPKRSPSYGNGRTNHGHPPSPARTPPDLPDDVEIHSYSLDFLSLYDDRKFQTIHVNSHAGLQVSNAMSDWLRDPEKMQKETGLSYADVFQNLPTNIDTFQIPPTVERTKKPHSGTTLQWQCLKAPSPINKDVPLIELNGQIGFQKAYCMDKQNRWQELTSPLPFVFFHPQLPLYIDTRKEGSEARFVRRSCRPNTVLETYLSDGREYHFWLVSDRQIAAKEEITIPWDFRFPNNNLARMLRILGLGDEEMGTHPEPTLDEAEYQTIATWVHLVLSEHGGCACDLGTDCAFARFHRNYYGKTQPRPSAPKAKKRKPKAQHAISPTSTGHATNSRAASEGHMEDVPEHDGRSVSGSSRSKPGSRDMTPTARQGSFDQLGILTEPTDRDKRKVTMIEDSFRRMEQQQEHKQPARKRKRVSDGTGSSKAKSTKANSEAPTPTLPNGFPERHYVDAGTSRSKSGSPTSATSPHGAHPPRRIELGIESALSASHGSSISPHANYCDASVQTDPEDGAWYRASSPVDTPKRRLVSLSKRLLDNRHRLRLDEDERRKRLSVDQEATPSVMEAESPNDAKTPIPSPSLGQEPDSISPTGSVPVRDSSDTPISDAAATSPTGLRPNGLGPANTMRFKTSPDLRVQMPPVPAFCSPTASAPSSATTPLSAGASLVHSPFSATAFASPFGMSLNGVAANPSPVKKKLSLSDYTKSRMNKGASRPSVGTTALKPIPNSEDPKSATSVDTGGTLESPIAEKLNEVTSATTVA
ncbi:hypothetical protein B0T16DRAFT_303411, partial [Cercophora newfieldiana]